ncbi:unnamed protein product, partial [Medioppia subpectinata]
MPIMCPKYAKSVQNCRQKNLKALPVVADVTKEADLDRLLDTTIETFGKLDILVNNSGIGSFCHISDADRVTNRTGMSGYAMSKAAMDMFTKCIAVDLASKGIRVNSVNPGAVRTNIMRNMPVTGEQGGAIWDAMESKYPVGSGFGGGNGGGNGGGDGGAGDEDDNG